MAQTSSPITAMVEQIGSAIAKADGGSFDRPT
jgi:hypothetical protein